MPEIANAQLRVALLDPETDRALLGPRYCWAGYIWQVFDAKAGPLLTGPEWPKADPIPFNGQGLPESFRHSSRDGRRYTWKDNQGVAIGAGELALDPSGEGRVVRPSSWITTAFQDRIEYQTHQRAAGFDYELMRRVELSGRKIISTSKLTNHAPETLALEWFPHPFFALTDRLIRVEFPRGSSLPENPGFTLTGRALTQKRRFEHVKDGHVDFVKLPPNEPLTATVSHPVIERIVFSTSYVPSLCMIWGNNNTFSIEPYQALSLASGESKEWSVSYDFGP